MTYMILLFNLTSAETNVQYTLLHSVDISSTSEYVIIAQLKRNEIV